MPYKEILIPATASSINKAQPYEILITPVSFYEVCRKKWLMYYLDEKYFTQI